MGLPIPKGYINDILFGHEIWYIRNAGTIETYMEDIIYVDPIEFRKLCERETK